MTMKLNFFFIVVTFLTLLAYPIVFVHSKLRQFYKSEESSPVQDFFVPVPITPGR